MLFILAEMLVDTQGKVSIQVCFLINEGFIKSIKK